LLNFGGGLNVTQVHSIKEITTCVERAADLTRQLLLFSRREVFQPGPLDLNEAIQSTINMLKRIIREDVDMQFKLATGPLRLMANRGMLNQVLLNLAVNARDAMPNGGRLLIETSTAEFDELATAQSINARAGSFACLSVSDNGCGIPPENLPHIFEPFYTTKAVGKGTGLGLASVFGIVQQHQGWVNVYSELGQGTMFRIYLPRLLGEAIDEIAPIPLPPMRGGTETILLVEDEPALRLAVHKALAQLGYCILEAASGVKALAVWQEHRHTIDLLLTDLVMPDGLSGKDLADCLLKENPTLKVTYMSGYSAEVVGKDFPLQEGIHFLNKPFSIQHLARTLRNCLEAPA
jgi:CheY-like chemotaxis protein